MVWAALYERGMRGPRGGKLRHGSIRNLPTNPALIGRVNYPDEVAEKIKTEIKDCIAAERGCREFEHEIRELTDLDGLKTQQVNFAHLVTKMAKVASFDENDPLVAELDTIGQRITAAERGLADARRFAGARESAWEKLAGIILGASSMRLE